MSSGVGTTTVTLAGSPVAGVAARELAIVWRFPRAGEPPVPLRLDGESERVLGRDADCAVRLDGNEVSRRHAVLRCERSSATFDAGTAGEINAIIADLGSRNGVRVNGHAVSHAPLGPQDVVRLGGWIGVVTADVGEVEEITPGFWGGAGLRATLAPLQQLAKSDLPIVLQGETGTGKELVAGALHRWSGRPGPLVAVNCAALPETLAEGELFGYRRGAFTGADRASPGFFRSADHGTLLLDEISDLPLALQAKLLRVLEQREVQPLGEARPVPVDVRVVVAGQQPLMEAVRAGRFRADLMGRIDGLTVQLPPLRERREDVLPLFSHLLKSIGRGQAPTFESELAERLCLHDWPFNVRELVLLVRRLLALHGTEATLQARHLPERIGEDAAGAGSSKPPTTTPAASGRASADLAPAEPVQLPALMVALRTSGGNVARAATILGISRQRAYRLMEGESIDLEAIRGNLEKAR